MIKKETSKTFRGLAIILVVASHYAEWIGASETGTIGQFIMRLGDFGVDIFFFLSGYGLARAAFKTGINLNFIRRRGISVYFPYLIILTVMELMDGRFLAADKSWFNFFTGFDYWFMRNLFLFYLFFFICWKLRKMRNLLLAVFVFAYSYYLLMSGRIEFWYVSNIAFVMGAFVGDKEDFLKKFLKKLPVKLPGLVLITYSLYMANREFALPKEAESLVFLHFLFTLGLLLLLSGKEIKGYVLSLSGSYSLYFYLLHTRLFHAMYWNWQLPEGLKAVLVFICSALISIAVGFVCQDVLLKGIQRLNVKK
ncbi:MAG: acyltransferase [Lachnospiraceae bacterium]|nr:acyltransferase [Lachnospiraceae bacterium]MDY5700611.1 acyltransferase [Lachnospiraceae bacterium]